MNHQVLWAAVIVGSFIMNVFSRYEKDYLAAWLWVFVAFAALSIGYLP